MYVIALNRVNVTVMTMAYSYQKRGSPWFFIRFKDPTGKWRSKSTRYRIDNTLHRAKATAEAARIGVNEKRKDCGSDWVDDLIENHPVSALTKVYYRNCRWIGLVSLQIG